MYQCLVTINCDKSVSKSEATLLLGWIIQTGIDTAETIVEKDGVLCGLSVQQAEKILNMRIDLKQL